MDFRTFLQQNIVLLDGGTGTLLQEAGLPLGQLPERWNITHADVLTGIHRDYYDAGSNVVCTNTFGANPLKFAEAELESIVASAVENVKRAAALSTGKQEKFIALDIGPLGKLLKPYGDLAFEDAVNAFKTTVEIGVKAGVHLIFIETMNDSYETKAAVLAAKETCDLPILVSGVYGTDKKLMTGADPAAMTAMLEGLGVDGLGANCSLGPKQLAPTVAEFLACAEIPVLVKPNAGLPVASFNGEKGTKYDITPEEFAETIALFVEQGARLVGGCCGTTPEYIREVKKRIGQVKPKPIAKKNIPCVSSYTHAVALDKPIIIGERINPTGKKRFKQALINGETEYALSEAITQKEQGAHILDVNVGLPDIDEESVLPFYVEKLQATVDLPLQIDTSNIAALEKAMRLYNGKPLVNSVNGKRESMASVFPLVKKYGGAVVALTLDEKGIPDTAEGRVAIARRIIEEAEKYGIPRKDILVDTLTMSVATDKRAAETTLTALKQVKQTLGVSTVLGVSNVSFGLPAREIINSAFYALALENGLMGGIINPCSLEMQKTYRAYCALKGYDENCQGYIRFANQNANQNANQALPVLNSAVKAENLTEANTSHSPLQTAIIRGLKESAEKECAALLQAVSPLEIIEKEIVPALDNVGKAYEEKRAYLPELLISAEAAKGAFETLRSYWSAKGETQAKKCKFVIATVQGDIHDIGKNIVKTLLENYGFDVIDLGKDVPCEEVVKAVEEHRAPLVGLSALMTTTVASMQTTVRMLRERTPWCKILVGGAVLNADYAQKIGADFYGKDGMETVRYAERFYSEMYKNMQK